MLHRKLATAKTTPPPRALAVLLACLCFVGQLASSAHLFIVEHALCPEHGELVHIAATAAASQAARQDPLPSLSGMGQSWLGNSSTRSGHDHEHCFLASQQRGQPLPEAPSGCGAPLPSATLPRSAPDLPAVLAPFALYRLAPKNSPPAV